MGTLKSGGAKSSPKLREMFALADMFPSSTRATQDLRIELPRGGMSSLIGTEPGTGLAATRATSPRVPIPIRQRYAVPILVGLLLVAAYRG